MFEVLDFVYSNNLNVKGLFLVDFVLIFEVLYNIEEDEDVVVEYCKECYMVYDVNCCVIFKCILVLCMIFLVCKFVQYEVIYFLYDVDSCGCVYLKFVFLNLQGFDYVKGLLEFFEGKVIEIFEYEGYLVIVIVNVWGQDKLFLVEWVQWVEDNEVMF